MFFLLFAFVVLLSLDLNTGVIDEATIKNRRNSDYNMQRLKVAHWYLFPYRRSGIDARHYDDAGNPYDEKKSKKDPGFTYKFPVPAIKTFSLHEGTRKHCKNEKTVAPCLDYIYNTLHRAKSQRGDVLLTSTEDFTPFRDRFERFQFQATALYFLCWHTMKRDPVLKFFGFNCGQTPFDRSDYRYDNANGPPWGCAMVTFCPDPCCGNVTTSTEPALIKGEFNKEDHPTCQSHPSYPCKHIKNPQCRISLQRNVDFDGLKANKINLTCGCPTGFQWSTPAKRCLDIDECYERTHTCRQNRVCRNEEGKYRCDCPYGYIYDEDVQECIKHVELDAVLLERSERELKEKQAKGEETNLLKSWGKIKQTLFRVFAVPDTSGGTTTARKCHVGLVFIPTFITYFIKCM